MSRRLVRTGLRTAHLLAFGAYYGGHVFDVAPDRLLPALVAAVGTGSLFMAFEVWSAPVWLVQVRGVATYAKIALVLAAGLFWEHRVALLTVVVAIGAVTSHMPGRYRYYSLRDRRIVETHAKG